MVTLANLITILLVVVDISLETATMSTLLVIPLMITSATLSAEKRYYSVGACSVALGYVYKAAMLSKVEVFTVDYLKSVNQMSTVVMLSAYLLLAMVMSAIIIIQQCKIEGPVNILERKFQIIDTSILTTLYLWFIIICIYFGCNGFFKSGVLCVTSCTTIGLLSVAFVSLKSTLRKAVNDEKAKRLEQGTDRVEVSGGTTN